MATTYKKLAELIREAYYNGKPSDDANHTEAYFAELIAIEVAKCATQDAYVNSNNGEATYASGQFISTFNSVPILVKSDGTIYSVLPSTPPALPNGQEITSVKIDGNKCLEFIPQKAQSSFAQNLIGSVPFNLYVISGKNIIYKPKSPLFDATDNTATIEMVGAISGTDLLSSDLIIPKNYEGVIWDNIMAKILPTKQIQQDLINDSVSNQG